MKQSLARCALITALLTLAQNAVLSQSKTVQHADAAATVKEFYTFHFRNKFDYSIRGLRLRRKWLDPTLYQLLIAELKRPSKPDEVPDLDGDPFTDSQEPPASFRISKLVESGEKATGEVVFSWKDKGKVLEERKIEVQLTKSSDIWRIANIRADHADGDLVQWLKRSG